jgi:hypothetical protein
MMGWRFTGRISDQDAKSIIAYGKQSSLQARFERLPMEDALRVYDVATPKEKQNWLRH